jgi:hypothetical protein
MEIIAMLTIVAGILSPPVFIYRVKKLKLLFL